MTLEKEGQLAAVDHCAFSFFDEVDELIGDVDIHVDDTEITGTEKIIEDRVEAMKNEFGALKKEVDFTNCGMEWHQKPDAIILEQKKLI